MPLSQYLLFSALLSSPLLCFCVSRRAKQESTTATRLEEERKMKMRQRQQKRQQERQDEEEEEEESDDESRAKDDNLRRFLSAWARRLKYVVWWARLVVRSYPECFFTFFTCNINIPQTVYLSVVPPPLLFPWKREENRRDATRRRWWSRY